MSTLRIRLLRIVPFHVALTRKSTQAWKRNECTHGLPIIQISCLPEWVIPGPEGSTIEVKLIREDEIPSLCGVLKRRFSVCALGRIRIDETDVVNHLGNLPR